MSDLELISLDVTRMGALADLKALETFWPQMEQAHYSLQSRAGAGSEMLGWMDLPAARGEEFERLIECAQKHRESSDLLIVVGIGGSYLGARAVSEALALRDDQDGPELAFAGHHLEGRALEALLKNMDEREVSVNVISKSGTTTEPAIAFRLIRAKLEKMYGAEKAAERIIATTDASRGALRELATQNGYETFIVPDDVGGRFSVLSPVGLFPLAAVGVDIEALLTGASAEAVRCAEAQELDEAPALRYAVARHAAHMAGYGIEVLASFHPSLHYVAEWWKQLFGESEGKQGRGLFPASVDYTTDLHSLGQYLQDGRRTIIETFVDVNEPAPGPEIPEDKDDLDGLNYLRGWRVDQVNARALAAVADAHLDGGVPSQTITLPSIDETSLGSLLYFFEYAVALGGRLLGVNPFDQPGVEAYKANLFRLLGKPGVSS